MRGSAKRSGGVIHDLHLQRTAGDGAQQPVVPSLRLALMSRFHAAYGAAGSFVLILLWVYYSAIIFLFGAEITRFYSERVGSRAGAKRHDTGSGRRP